MCGLRLVVMVFAVVFWGPVAWACGLPEDAQLALSDSQTVLSQGGRIEPGAHRLLAHRWSHVNGSRLQDAALQVGGLELVRSLFLMSQRLRRVENPVQLQEAAVLHNQIRAVLQEVRRYCAPAGKPTPIDGQPGAGTAAKSNGFAQLQSTATQSPSFQALASVFLGLASSIATLFALRGAQLWHQAWRTRRVWCKVPCAVSLHGRDVAGWITELGPAGFAFRYGGEQAHRFLAAHENARGMVLKVGGLALPIRAREVSQAEGAFAFVTPLSNASLAGVLKHSVAKAGTLRASHKPAPPGARPVVQP